MSKKKQRGARGARAQPNSRFAPVQRWVKKHTGWLGSVGALVVIVGAALYFANPWASYTAIDENGNKVATGIIEDEDAAPRVGRPAPDFVLADYDGRAVWLSDFRGKTVLLNFWATWCTACESEMPDMQQLVEQHPDDFVVLAVNQAESTGRAKSWTDDRDLTMLHFAMDKKEDVSRGYRLPRGLPHSFFIDPDGTVRAVRHGGMRYSEMKQLFAQTKAAAAAEAAP